MATPEDAIMCSLIDEALFSRRALLGGAGAALAATSLGALARPAAAAAGDARTRVVLLGTMGGPARDPSGKRTGIASALVVDRDVYLIDCGEGFGLQLVRAGLAATGYRQRAVFLTHLHSDHVVDYANLVVLGLFNGLGRPRPTQIYGPGRRGAMEPVSGRPAAGLPVIAPENPTPGTVDMTNSLLAAYATDLNDRIRDTASPDVRTLIEVHDIALPGDAAAHPDAVPSVAVEPFAVYEDENVRVTATLVDHQPVFPSFAFRFETSDGSVVFGGDTGVSQNLIRLARGSDVLVHEVIDKAAVDARFGAPPHTPAQAALLNHLLRAHTTVEDVGPVAEKAGAKTLVLTHFVPGNAPDSTWQAAQTGYSGKLIVGHDLLQIPLAR
jgi:ribonuclease BN (tRNA processing enzyme)